MFSALQHRLTGWFFVGVLLLSTGWVWAEPSTAGASSGAPAVVMVSSVEKSTVTSSGKYVAPELKIVTRPGFGPKAGKAAEYEFPKEEAISSAKITYLFWGATAAVLLLTVLLVLKLAVIRNADGSTTRGFTLGAKLTAGFGVLATLILLVSAIAAGAQVAGSNSISALRDSSNETSVVNDLLSDALMVHMKMKDFLMGNAQEDLDQYSNWAAGAMSKLSWLQKHNNQQEIVKLTTELQKQLDEYFATVEQVVKVIDQRNGIIDSQMTPAVERITVLINETMNTAQADGDLTVAYEAASAMDRLQRARVNFFRYMRTGDVADAKRVMEHAEVGSKIMNHLTELAKNPKRQLWLAEAEQAFGLYGSLVESNIELVAKRNELVVNRLDNIGPAIRKVGQELVALERDGDVKVTQAARSDANAALVKSIAASLIAVVVAIIVAVLLIRSITAAVNKVLNVLRAIAAGDLTQDQLRMTSKDEMGELARATDRMSDSLTELVTQVSQATREVASAATQIAASSEEMATGMKEQTDQVSQVSAAIEEMSQSIVEVAKKSGEAASNAGESGKTAQDGGQIVDKTIDGMSSISQAVTASASAVQELGKRGEQIGAIIKVINDIADQTNLLALNAAIEAARAGEHGRGFAVVADEVRKLADRTTKATEEIAGSIQAIQTETGQAVERMNAGTKEVEQGVHLATDAGKSLAQIVTAAQNVATMIQSIAAAAEQQSSASEEISRNIEAISAVTKQANEGAGQAAAAAAQLSSKAEQLQVLVSRFRMRNQDRVNTPTTHPTPTRSGNPGSTQAPSHRSQAQGAVRHAA